MFSSTFQGKFNFQGVFKTVLNIQVLFKPVQTLFLYKDNIVVIEQLSCLNVSSHAKLQTKVMPEICL